MTSPRFTVERLVWQDPLLGEVALPGGVLRATLGLGSGLTRRAGDPPGRLWALGDRGPNLKIKQARGDYGVAGLEHLSGVEGAKILPMPQIGPSLSELQITGDRIDCLRTLPLRAASGAPVTGLPLPGGAEASMEPLFDLEGRPLGADVNGADSEAVVALADGSFWVAEEYGPSLMKISPQGVVQTRWTPRGLVWPGAQDLLPAIAGRRRLNRGFEGLAVSADETRLYAGFQSAFEGDDAGAVRIWTLDAASGALLAEHSYPFDPPETFLRDVAAGPVEPADLKIGELLCVGEGRLLVLERISHTSKIYEVDLAGGGDVLRKTLILTSDDAPEIAPDLEGMILLSDREILLVNDNDFGIEGVETRFFRVTLQRPLQRPAGGPI